MDAPFTSAEAREQGLGRGALRGPSVSRRLRGVYLPAQTPVNLAVEVAAARKVLPSDALLDGCTALHAYGVEVGAAHPLRFVSAHPHQVRRPGVVVRRVGTLPPSGKPGMVGAEAAFRTAALGLDLCELVAAGDRLLSQELASTTSLSEAAAAARGRGVVPLRRAVGLVREGTDSVRETRLRLCLVLAGLPEPEVNPVVVVGGRQVGRVDLLLRAWRVVIEYEGDQHRTDRRQWNVDISRQEQLVGADYLLIRVSAERMRHPRAVVAVVYRALRERGWDGPPPTFDQEWHRLFPSAP